MSDPSELTDLELLAYVDSEWLWIVNDEGPYDEGSQSRELMAVRDEIKRRVEGGSPGGS